jgi:methylglutaconyl-CoA hydratase
MKYQTIRTETAHGVARVIMNRPEVHNAFDEHLIGELTSELRHLDHDTEVRVVVLAASGKSFSAGADLNWMKRMAGYSEAENLRDAVALAGLMRTLRGMRKPTLARVQGAAYGGGVGLVACCDIAVAATEATFSLSEVRLGLIPSVVSPYVIAAIGERAASRFFLTGERFDATEAKFSGLVHEVVHADKLDETLGRIIGYLLQGGPHAVAAAKKLIADVAHRPVDDGLMEDTARRIAAIRVTPEGKEGINAFLEKRPASWVKKSQTL